MSSMLGLVSIDPSARERMQASMVALLMMFSIPAFVLLVSLLG